MFKIAQPRRKGMNWMNEEIELLLTKEVRVRPRVEDESQASKVVMLWKFHES